MSQGELDIKQAFATIRAAFNLMDDAVPAANSALFKLELELIALRSWKKAMEEKLEEMQKPRRQGSFALSIANLSAGSKARIEDVTRMTVCPTCYVSQGPCFEQEQPIEGFHEARVLKAVRATNA